MYQVGDDKLTSHILHATDTRRLELIILPTEKCNFRCKYCYEQFHLGKMPEQIITGIKMLLSRRRNELRQLKISWFGGEPLLAKDVILNISTFANSLATTTSTLEYSGNITTNGYLLTPDVLIELVNCGVRHFQVTLDGDELEHDRLRLTRRGNPTFKRLWGNLLALKSIPLEFDVVLRAHYSRTNIDSVVRLLSDIRSEFGGDARYRVFLKALSKLGSQFDTQMSLLSSQEKKSLVERLTSSYGDMICISADVHSEDHYCYASALNSFVVRANGRIGKCTVALNERQNDIGALTEDGLLQVDNEKLRNWVRGLSTFNPNHLACPLTISNSPTYE